MRILMFYHSALSDWNHGNAHFLRGIATELCLRGHDVRIYEPSDAWSLRNLIREHGEAPVRRVQEIYPHLNILRYDLKTFALRTELAEADLVLVHEWNDPALVAAIGEHRLSGGNYSLFFHDTHHRSVTAAHEMSRYDLSGYDGVLVYGASIRDVYLANKWSRNVWVWHEAADTRIFYPRPTPHSLDKPANNGHHATMGNGSSRRQYAGDLVWIGNWGDDERAAEIQEFLIAPVKALGLKARVYGVRYPDSAVRALADAGIEYAGWLPNFEVPTAFSSFRITVHIPRSPYVRHLPGIPTIRPFEALACGIALVSAFWNDTEMLFSPGRDYLVARNQSEMKRHLETLLAIPDFAGELAEHGRQTVLQRHTCSHRADALLRIYKRSQLHSQGVFAS